MKEQKIKTEIGSRIHVMVLFDYEPEQKETAFDEQRDEVVTINEVLAFSSSKLDITECLSDECLDRLKVECIEYINQF